ncbi:hypothetical protein [Treponema zioleckii]|uniref:hypothetical protein n=1 Tax=Treponema zioleckii TaxID=331680 RepID=UPI00168A4FF8|nr:hypothetical protein [Treponema zioleckii]
MRKSIFAIFIVATIACTSIFAIGGKKNVYGHIEIYGSAPMTFVGFVTEEGEKYSIDIAPDANFTIDDFTKYQGKRLKLTGIVNSKELWGFQTLENGRFVVSKFKVAPAEKK